MATCKSCGRETAEAKFCQFCGSPLEAPAVPPPSPTGTPPPSAPAAQAPPAVVPVAPPPGVAPPPTAPLPGAAPPPMSPPPGMTQQPGMPAAARYPVQRAARSGATTSSGAQIWGGVGLAAMMIVMIGSFLPWAQAFYASKGGMEGDGKITLFFAVIAGAFFLVGLIGKARWPFVVGLIVTIITGAIFVIDIADVVNTLSLSNVGSGLYVGLAGAALGLVAAVGGIAARRE
ncbi:MAG: hypothetical protein KKB90_09250 [Actinobacteria bacterium]|nr:hypothetical protein [Actinomycetota bacterium]MBU4219127.1 hypothetical protein [Actinomycetota bacterium]MBU4358414.1 hypothetical protein [Actinomycetota bacterium]MCG2817504.1 hypothetical protein [Actinomycetes bacterium]